MRGLDSNCASINIIQEKGQEKEFSCSSTRLFCIINLTNQGKTIVANNLIGRNLISVSCQWCVLTSTLRRPYLEGSSNLAVLVQFQNHSQLLRNTMPYNDGAVEVSARLAYHHNEDKSIDLLVAIAGEMVK